MKTEWTPKTITLAASGVIAALFALPKLGDGLDYARKVLGTTEVAYAAKEQAEQVDDQFQQYLQKQQAYTDALNSYVAQQQQQRELCQEDENGTVWCCPVLDADACWAQNLWRRRR